MRRKAIGTAAILLWPGLLLAGTAAAGALEVENTGEPSPAGDRFILQEVVVTGTRTPHILAEVPVETVLISREEIERSPAANLPQLLRTMAGVSATNLDDTLAADNLRLTLRGLQLNEGYGLILVDGWRVHGGFGGHGDYGISLNQLPLQMIERVEIVKGAASALYGADAMAGVINIITRPVPEKTGGAAGGRFEIYDVLPRAGMPATDASRRAAMVHGSVGGPVGSRSGFLLQFATSPTRAATGSPGRRSAIPCSPNSTPGSLSTGRSTWTEPWPDPAGTPSTGRNVMTASMTTTAPAPP